MTGKDNTNHRETVRIDFHQTSPGGWVVARFTQSDQGVYVIKERCEHGPESTFDVEDSLRWMTDNGWIVRRWPTGARAWKLTPQRVRSSGAAKRLLEETLAKIEDEDVRAEYNQLDPLYDL